MKLGYKQDKRFDVMARKGDTPEYLSRMQQELFDVMAKARSLDELRMIRPMAQEVWMG